mmetsp:Transcript_2208/g.5163  ORF Transcript_2208/g.5163 Transcript_2208/m.5163 type:complete len:93 (+) Transcript_2208:859-1137(+)
MFTRRKPEGGGGIWIPAGMARRERHPNSVDGGINPIESTREVLLMNRQPFWLLDSFVDNVMPDGAVGGFKTARLCVTTRGSKVQYLSQNAAL